MDLVERCQVDCSTLLINSIFDLNRHARYIHEFLSPELFSSKNVISCCMRLRNSTCFSLLFSLAKVHINRPPLMPENSALLRSTENKLSRFKEITKEQQLYGQMFCVITFQERQAPIVPMHNSSSFDVIDRLAYQLHSPDTVG